MPDAGNGSVQLLEADPDLARGLDPRRVREVSQRLFARSIDVPRGPWSPARALSGGTNPIGLLVLDGLLVREAIVGDHPCAELLGPGDLLRAWDDRDAEVLLPRSVEWSALSQVRLAVIDQALAVRAAQWPEIFASLVERAARRAERLVVMQAIAHLTRVDDRLLALLWCLAERWGRVAPGGVVVSLRLPHRTLAGMVGARRPSVTTALGQLHRPRRGGAPPRRRLAPARRSARGAWTAPGRRSLQRRLPAPFGIAALAPRSSGLRQVDRGTAGRPTSAREWAAGRSRRNAYWAQGGGVPFVRRRARGGALRGVETVLPRMVRERSLTSDRCRRRTPR